MENRHRDWELRQMQNLPLKLKIQKTRRRIKEWYDHFDGGAYLSFSGGKDSTVLRDIVLKMRLNIPSVYIDTGLEYPEVRKFAIENADVVLRPEMNFRQVILTYGYPVISKEIAQCIQDARKGLKRGDGSYSYPIKKLQGLCTKKDGTLSSYNHKKWAFMLDAPFSISAQCCKVMKKAPAKKYEKETGRHPMIATMACESALRRQRWLRYGCNAFNDKERPASNPISFWTENDVLHYLWRYKAPYASIYGEIHCRYNGKECPDRAARRCLDEYPESESKFEFYTTGVDRTGCMFCAFGAHLEDHPNRFQRMKETHPKQYDYCMRPVDRGGLGMAEVLDYAGIEH